MQITLREYQKEDFQELENIIRETWHYDEFSSSETAARLARVFLNSCLTNHTFSRVAVWNGKPVGIILCKIISGYKCPPEIQGSTNTIHSVSVFIQRGTKRIKNFRECKRY